MPRPLRLKFPGAFYHALCRGNERRDVFRADDDRELFLATLEDCSERFTVPVHSYCLMDNHIHLLIETKLPNLSEFMKRLLGVYTLRFNRIHKRVGHLFQGRYKAFLVDQDEYLLQLSRYIHLNPVKAGIARAPESYPWSSLRFFMSSKNSPAFLEQDLILGQFANRAAHLEFVRGGITTQTPKVITRPLGGAFIASQDYVMRFKDQLSRTGQDFRKRECLRVPLDILHEITEFEDLGFKEYAFWTIGKVSQPEIAALSAKSQSAVSHSIKRFRTRLSTDKKLLAKIQTIERAVSCFMD